MVLSDAVHFEFDLADCEQGTCSSARIAYLFLVGSKQRELAKSYMEGGTSKRAWDQLVSAEVHNEGRLSYHLLARPL